jgi:TonB dependent receptor
VNGAIRYLFLEQEFTCNGDDGTFSPGDKTKREGIDLSLRYQICSWLYPDLDAIFCKARDAQAPKGNNYLPLSVPLNGTAGHYFKMARGFSGGWTWRYMKDRPANNDNLLTAQGYLLNDLTANYTEKRFEVGLEI